jgi:hypothetical protein
VTESDRRDFLGRAGALVAALSLGTPAAAFAAAPGVDPEELSDMRQQRGPWDLSWVARLTGVPYRAVFDANAIAEGYAFNLAAGIMDQFREAYGTRDDQTRMVIVMRQLGTPLAFGDALWDKFAIGADTKENDPSTKQPARRNPYLSAPQGSGMAPFTLDALRARGAIFLLCNIAMNNWSRRTAEKVGRTADEVVAEVKAGLAPGVILVPSGVFALVLAQNLGCAYMRGA